MKDLLNKYITIKKSFEEEKKGIEKSFGEFIESIPGWRDILGSIIIVRGYYRGTLNDVDDIGSILIPVFRDIDFIPSTGYISFKIRILSVNSSIPEYINIGPLPFDEITSGRPDPDYIRQKISREEECLEELKGDLKSLTLLLDNKIKEIEKLKTLIEKGE